MFSQSRVTRETQSEISRDVRALSKQFSEPRDEHPASVIVSIILAVQSTVTSEAHPVRFTFVSDVFDEQLRLVNARQYVQSSEVNALVLQSRVANAGSS